MKALLVPLAEFGHPLGSTLPVVESWGKSWSGCRNLNPGPLAPQAIKKKTVPSGGFAADCFFDVTDLQPEVPRESRDGIAGLVSPVDG